jgi:hypothetical protein
MIHFAKRCIQEGSRQPLSTKRPPCANCTTLPAHIFHAELMEATSAAMVADMGLVEHVPPADISIEECQQLVAMETEHRIGCLRAWVLHKSGDTEEALKCLGALSSVCALQPARPPNSFFFLTLHVHSRWD